MNEVVNHAWSSGGISNFPVNEIIVADVEQVVVPELDTAVEVSRIISLNTKKLVGHTLLALSFKYWRLLNKLTKSWIQL